MHTEPDTSALMGLDAKSPTRPHPTALECLECIYVKKPDDEWCEPKKTTCEDWWRTVQSQLDKCHKDLLSISVGAEFFFCVGLRLEDEEEQKLWKSTLVAMEVLKH